MKTVVRWTKGSIRVSNMTCQKCKEPIGENIAIVFENGRSKRLCVSCGRKIDSGAGGSFADELPEAEFYGEAE